MMHALQYYRQRLANLFKTRPDKLLVSLTADLCKAELVDLYGFHKPIVHIDTGIREQHMLAMAYGLSKTDPNVRILIGFGEITAYRAADQFNDFW